MGRLQWIAEITHHIESLARSGRLRITVVSAKAMVEDNEVLIELTGTLSQVERIVGLIERERRLHEVELRETIPIDVDPQESRTWTLSIKL
jgi:uncharacterized protein YbcI